MRLHAGNGARMVGMGMLGTKASETAIQPREDNKWPAGGPSWALRSASRFGRVRSPQALPSFQAQWLVGRWLMASFKKFHSSSEREDPFRARGPVLA
jgi:hypothetical protein